MRNATKRLPVAAQIRKGLEEALRHARGGITLKTTVLPWPDAPPSNHADASAAPKPEHHPAEMVRAKDEAPR